MANIEDGSSLAVYARFKSINFFKYYKQKIIILVGAMASGPPKSGPAVLTFEMWTMDGMVYPKSAIV